MLDPATAALFFGASVVLGIAPGPDNLFVLMQSALHGRSAGLMVTLGLCTGLLVHTVAVAIGVAGLIAASEAAFTTLKYAGAGYLLWLAAGAFRSGIARPRTGNPERASVAGLPPSQTAPPAPRSLFALYRRGIVMNIVNPKILMFFMAFLPQFALPERGSVAVQIVLLGALFILATVLVFSCFALLGATIGAILNRSTIARRGLDLAAAAVFTAMAMHLLYVSGPGA